MTTTTNPVFSQQMFATPQRRQTDKNGAVQGFAQIFASMLSTELRRGPLGSDAGPMGIGGGATGDVYGAFFDQAISKVLARSPAMKPLNDMISRQLGGPGNQNSASGVKAITALPQAGNTFAQPVSYTAGAPPVASEPAVSTGSSNSTATDSRGPVLLPPPPAMFAPVLPPPTNLTEG